MALKPDRVEHLTDLSFFMNETGDRGGIVTFRVSAAASGAAMDDAKRTCWLSYGNQCCYVRPRQSEACRFIVK